MTVTGHSRDTPGQTPNATNHATPLHNIIYQGNLRPTDRTARKEGRAGSARPTIGAGPALSLTGRRHPERYLSYHRAVEHVGGRNQAPRALDMAAGLLLT